MNRQIKFRGKCVDNEDWIIGNLLITDNNPNDPFHSMPIRKQTQIVAYFPGDWGMGGWDCIDVSPDTVGQFTGRFDKNGKEIYEGDMVRIRENIGLENVGVVQFIDGCFFVMVEKSKTYTFRHALHIKNSVWKDMNANIPIEYEYEVLGNIHDNPELLNPIKPWPRPTRKSAHG